MVWSSPHLWRGLEIQVGRLMVDFELKYSKPFIPFNFHLLGKTPSQFCKTAVGLVGTKGAAIHLSTARILKLGV